MAYCVGILVHDGLIMMDAALASATTAIPLPPYAVPSASSA